jgi:hypothetical protein
MLNKDECSVLHLLLDALQWVKQTCLAESITSGRSRRVTLICGNALTRGKENAPMPEPTSQTEVMVDHG